MHAPGRRARSRAAPPAALAPGRSLRGLRAWMGARRPPIHGMTSAMRMPSTMRPPPAQVSTLELGAKLAMLLECGDLILWTPSRS